MGTGFSTGEDDTKPKNLVFLVNFKFSPSTATSPPRWKDQLYIEMTGRAAVVAVTDTEFENATNKSHDVFMVVSLTMTMMHNHRRNSRGSSSLAAQTYIDVKFELKDGYPMTLLKRSDLSQDSTLNDPLKSDILKFLVRSNFTGLKFSSFYIAILERNGELIAAPSISVNVSSVINDLNFFYACSWLSLDVEELVIPAIPELFDTWTKVFGFKPLQKSNREAMKSKSIIVFPGRDMLQKPLYKNQVADNNLSCFELVC
ncbi:Acyl-CoA N-acyltransferase [Artemisia annua]|uniref:Acyl-CoA N-acyltransferase n=1 Tax=Artemisia annua TaxID=35608 RepID=A0A2U1QAN2_ARTAN|nr:Acyl-CoA N-acyltransferase [Artemisia annua]